MSFIAVCEAVRFASKLETKNWPLIICAFALLCGRWGFDRGASVKLLRSKALSVFTHRPDRQNTHEDGFDQ